MLLSAALLAAATPQQRLDQLVVEWCATRQPDTVATCTDAQRSGLARFVAISRQLHDPRRAQASACLGESAAAPSIDWAAAGRCLYDAYLKGIERWRDPDQLLAPTPLPRIGWVPVAPRNVR